jgi:hypothetical protein
MFGRARGFLFAAALMLAGSAAASPPPYPNFIPDLSYIKRTYFLVSDQVVKIDLSTLRVFRDDLIQSNNLQSVPGIARLNTLAPFDSVENPEFAGNFDLLTAGDDYDVISPWLINSPPGFGVPVIRLKHALGENEVLAVAYVDQSSGANVSVGDVTRNGSPALGVPIGAVLLKMIKPKYYDVYTDFTGWYDLSAPWYPTLFYELRNFYDLGVIDIPLDRLRVAVRRIDLGQAVNPDNASGLPYIQMLGLDQEGAPNATDPNVPDGRIDPQFIDRADGIIFFLDMHPFDPDTTQGPGCGPGYGTSLCLDDFGRNQLREYAYSWQSPPQQTANPNVYYKARPDLATDTRYYLDVSLDPLPPPGGSLLQNMPNPFNPGTTIRFDMRRDGRARIAIYDVRGRLVLELLDSVVTAGPHEIPWSGQDSKGNSSPSGVYFCVLETDGSDDARRMVLVR